jgi:ribosome-associated toxin RatA of RatAB toxin-antitoxin module
MNTFNSIIIEGPIDRIFELAARVEDWPKLLPHYRNVDVIRTEGSSRVVRMRCVRAFGPIRWRCRWAARQQILRDEWRILFQHLAGPARGMMVEWRLEPAPDGVRTTISHELTHRLGSIYTDRLVGPLFVSAIAGQTLRTIKALVEAEGDR